MRASASFALSVLLVLAGVSIAFAAETPRMFEGRIAAVDASGRTLAVKDSGKQMDFSIAEDALVMSGPRARAVSDLHKGDTVVVSYFERKGSNVAERIERRQSAASKGS
jgi:hypothetical protein